MPFTAKSGKFSANINTLTMGTGDKAIVLGGENVLPFYTFDASRSPMVVWIQSRSA